MSSFCIPLLKKGEPIEDGICKLCSEFPAKYVCPRCKIPYCSPDCYRSKEHRNCSEAFYRECVEENLTVHKCVCGRHSRINEILERNKIANEDDVMNACDLDNDDELLDSDDDEEIEDLKDRMKDVNFDDFKDVFGRLTEDEKQDFAAFVRKNYPVKWEFKKVWQPWWALCHPDMLSYVAPDLDYESICPTITVFPENKLPDINKLTRGKDINPCVDINIVNVVAAAVYTFLFFNGEYKDHPREALHCFTELCDVMRDNAVFDSVENAIESIRLNRAKSIWLSDKSIRVKADEDCVDRRIEIMKMSVYRIFKGPSAERGQYYIQCVLSELRELVDLASVAVKSQFSAEPHELEDFFWPAYQNFLPPEREKRRNYLYKKKFFFYMSLIKSGPFPLYHVTNYIENTDTYKLMLKGEAQFRKEKKKDTNQWDKYLFYSS